MSETQSTRRSRNQRYRHTPKGAAVCAWNRLTSRAGAKYGHRRCYATIEVRISREDFLAWAVPQYEAWFRDHPDATPSIDRVDSQGHYEAGNLRLIPRGENCRHIRTARNLHAPEGTLWCCTCRAYKPRQEFWLTTPTKANPLGYAGHCRPCSNVNRKALREKHKAQYG